MPTKKGTLLATNGGEGAKMPTMSQTISAFNEEDNEPINNEKSFSFQNNDNYDRMKPSIKGGNQGVNQAMTAGQSRIE